MVIKNKMFLQKLKEKNILEILSVSISFLIVVYLLNFVGIGVSFQPSDNISLTKGIVIFLVTNSFYVFLGVSIVGGILRRKSWSYWTGTIVMSFMILWWFKVYLNLLGELVFGKYFFIHSILSFLFPLLSMIMLIFKIIQSYKK